MSHYVLDTDMLTLFQRGHANICQRCLAQPPGTLALTIISVEEQVLGWYTRVRQARKDDELAKAYQGFTDVISFLSHLQIISFTEPAIDRYRQLQSLRLNTGKKDLRIAAIVQEFGAILVTRNLRDFRHVPNLVIEDWSV